MELETGEILLIGNIDNERMEHGKAVFEISKTEPVLLMEKDANSENQVHQITGEECLAVINKAASMNTSVQDNKIQHSR